MIFILIFFPLHFLHLPHIPLIYDTISFRYRSAFDSMYVFVGAGVLHIFLIARCVYDMFISCSITCSNVMSISPPLKHCLVV